MVLFAGGGEVGAEWITPRLPHCQSCETVYAARLALRIDSFRGRWGGLDVMGIVLGRRKLFSCMSECNSVSRSLIVPKPQFITSLATQMDKG